MRPPKRRRYAAAAAAIFVTLLAAGCGGASSAATDGQGEVFLQPAAVQGPDPYTSTTALSGGAPPPPPPVPASEPSPTRGLTLRTLSGATPGLYGGTQSIGSCDVEQQVTFLGGDQAKARAFARGAGISQSDIPDFLRGLTPVVLRADTRVTNHGYRNRSAAGFQAVLQSGTAVLVDGHGAPRVRCSCGNPLGPPVAVKGAVVHTGQSWAGYRPDKVVVVKPTVQIVNSLVIVDVINNTWIDRKAGTEGEEDKRPDVLPPVTPDDIFTYPPLAEPPETGDPTRPGDSTGPSDGTSSPAPPEQPPMNPPVEQVPDMPSDPLPPPVQPDVPPEEGVTPSQPDLLVPSEEPAEPDTFPG
ncbi:hypothetical protein FBY35_0943 [Streptomyces sp. SLBN-118]|uniref:DUF6777 domain-containing protein n=1 Tax=Streptomyces sp. SLBN-118 TaxID=2768454 RepID=UPI00116CCE10|nr:DUF6777 domain-containing protein [Streptomyces sp. SLBN-118]TQK50606.1 hypothetical protein FBY35_0943 [Streptomyces sp. SLBN-118]